MPCLVVLSSPSTLAFFPLVKPLHPVLVGTSEADRKAHPDFGRMWLQRALKKPGNGFSTTYKEEEIARRLTKNQDEQE